MTRTSGKKSGDVVAMSHAAEEALRVIKAGFKVVAVHPRSKAAHQGWEKSSVAAEDVPQVLRGQNYGIRTMGGATDIDLDCPEAVVLAPKFLLKTGAVFGRKSKSASHYLYWTDLYETEEVAVIKCKDLDGTTIAELRMGGGGNAAQTVGPGSVHESGEVVEWNEGCGPELAARAAGDETKRCFGEMCAAALLARHWPESGRHDASLPLAGWLARLGWDEDKAVAFVEAVAETAGDEEVKDRLSAVRDTFRKAKTDKKTTGFPTLKKLLGEELVTKVAEQLAPTAEVASRLLGEMNAEFCVVMDGAKTRALRFVTEELGGRKREVATFIGEGDFCSFYRNKFVLVGEKPVSVVTRQRGTGCEEAKAPLPGNVCFPPNNGRVARLLERSAKCHKQTCGTSRRHRRSAPTLHQHI